MAEPSDEIEPEVLNVKDLKVVFHTHDGTVHAVNNVNFYLRKGELLGVVGESGSGKSVTMMSLLKLLPSPPAEIIGGTIDFENQNLVDVDVEQMRKIRGDKIGFIFQDPMTSLNPVFTVGFQLSEPLKEHFGMDKKQALAKAAELLALVGIPSPEKRLRDYPHQFSGGMRQRVMIAIALACDPQVLIADEPTTALDVTIQAQILDLVRELRHGLGMGIVWITHDLGVVAGIADRVLVMYGGQIVEHATVNDLFKDPQHPYTMALLKTLPSMDDERQTRLVSIAGQPPALTQEPSACPFASRCDYVFDKCWAAVPPVRSVGEEHDVACWWDMKKGASVDE